MILMPDTVTSILAAGGGLTVHTMGKLPDTLIGWAAAAARGHARLTIVVNSVILPDTLISIAAAGKGAVAFEINESNL